MKSEVAHSLRPCIVKDKNALFHCWGEKSDVVHPSPMLGGYSGGQITRIVGIVENEDGFIQECYPYEIRFIDNLYKEFCFGEEVQNNEQ